MSEMVEINREVLRAIIKTRVKTMFTNEDYISVWSALIGQAEIRGHALDEQFFVEKDDLLKQVSMLAEAVNA